LDEYILSVGTDSYNPYDPDDHLKRSNSKKDSIPKTKLFANSKAISKLGFLYKGKQRKSNIAENAPQTSKENEIFESNDDVVMNKKKEKFSLAPYFPEEIRIGKPSERLLMLDKYIHSHRFQTKTVLSSELLDHLREAKSIMAIIRAKMMESSILKTQFSKPQSNEFYNDGQIAHLFDRANSMTVAKAPRKVTLNGKSVFKKIASQTSGNMVKVVDKKNSTIKRYTLLFPEMMAQQLNIQRNVESIAEEKKQDANLFVKFHFDKLSENSWNFLRSFVKHFIVDKYYVQSNSQEVCDLDLVSEEEEDTERRDLYKGKTIESINSELRKRVLEKLGELPSPTQIKTNYFRGGYNVCSMFRAQNSLQERERVIMAWSPPFIQFVTPSYLVKGKKYGAGKFKNKIFMIRGSYLYWFNREREELARGYANLKEAKVGLYTIPELKEDALIFHPRNDGKSLIIKLDLDGRKLRDLIIKILPSIEIQTLYFESRVVQGYIKTLSLITEKKIDEYFLDVIPMTPATDCKFLRAMKLFPSLIELRLYNVRFTDDGVLRLSDLLNYYSKTYPGVLKTLELVNNGFEQYNSSGLFKIICKDCLGNLDSINFSKNKIGDNIAIDVIKSIGKSVNLNPESSPISINLSNTGISDSSVLAMQFLFDSFKDNNERLIQLDFSNNRLTENGLGYLVALIVRKRVIKSLNVSRCELLGHEFINNFLNELRDNKTLTEIDYSFNNLEQKSLKKIYNFLYRNTAICSLKFTLKDISINSFEWERFHLKLKSFEFSFSSRDK